MKNSTATTKKLSTTTRNVERRERYALEKQRLEALETQKAAVRARKTAARARQRAKLLEKATANYFTGDTPRFAHAGIRGIDRGVRRWYLVFELTGSEEAMKKVSGRRRDIDDDDDDDDDVSTVTIYQYWFAKTSTLAQFLPDEFHFASAIRELIERRVPAEIRVTYVGYVARALVEGTAPKKRSKKPSTKAKK